MSDIDPEHNHPSQDDYYISQLDALRSLIGTAKAIQADIDAMGMGKAEPAQLPRQVPEELRYIMWRYWEDHRGEDHRLRHTVASAWLAGVSTGVLPPGPMVELTPARVAALESILHITLMNNRYGQHGTYELNDEALSDVAVVRAMLDEVEGTP